MNVEELTKRDAVEIEALFKAVWPAAYEYPEEWRRKRMRSREEIEREMDEGYRYFGIRIDGKLVGMYKLSIVGDGCFGEHQSIHPECRDRGLASAMYDQFLRYTKEKGCRRAFVNILVSQVPSIKCVEKFGFHKKGEAYEQSKGMQVQMYEKEV